METSTIQKLKNKAGRFVEQRLLQSGTVLEVRPWEPGTIIEIDLHLPQANMQLWNAVPYIKFRVAGLTYRDYTPSGWDAETSTCTIFVDAAHNGAGSLWARKLKKGDGVNYLKIDTTRHQPSPTSAVIALGDESSLGHLLALQQLTLPQGRFAGAILMDDARHRQQFTEYFRTPLQTVERSEPYGFDDLAAWVQQQHYTATDTMFYLTGNNILVSRLRKMLRDKGFGPRQIKVHGFWG